MVTVSSPCTPEFTMYPCICTPITELSDRPSKQALYALECGEQQFSSELVQEDFVLKLRSINEEGQWEEIVEETQALNTVMSGWNPSFEGEVLYPQGRGRGLKTRIQAVQ